MIGTARRSDPPELSTDEVATLLYAALKGAGRGLTTEELTLVAEWAHRAIVDYSLVVLLLDGRAGLLVPERCTTPDQLKFYATAPPDGGAEE